MRLSENFTLYEFEKASGRTLTNPEIARARYFVVKLLQPIRPFVGPIVITSFVRVPPNVGAGPHADGRGVDFVPADRSRKKMELMHALLSLLAERYGESLLELDHIHLSYPGTDSKYPVGKPGQTLVENRPGSPDFARYGRWRAGIVWTAAVAPFAVVVGAILALR